LATIAKRIRVRLQRNPAEMQEVQIHLKHLDAEMLLDITEHIGVSTCVNIGILIQKVN
jgi:hypothetical protein